MNRTSRDMTASNRSDGILLQLYSIAPAPSRDYHGLKITDDQVILNTWNVTHGRYVFPKVRKIDLVDFVDDKAWQQDVTYLFGVHMCDFIVDVATRTPVLCAVPNRAMLKIISMLGCNDILKLSQTSKIFWQLCNTNSAWRILFMKRTRREAPASRAELDEATTTTLGWKRALRKRLDMGAQLRRARHVRPLRTSNSLQDRLDATSTRRPVLKTRSLDDVAARRDVAADAVVGTRAKRFSTSINPNYCQLKCDE